MRSVSAAMDYLQRMSPPRIPDSCPEFKAASAGRRLWHVSGIGRYDKFGAAFERVGGVPAGFQLPTMDLLSGLHRYAVPLAFVLTGDRGRISVDAGIWSSRDNSAETLDGHAAVFGTVLASLYPVVRMTPSTMPDVSMLTGELVLGVPTVKPPTAYDGVVQYDKVIRSMTSERFQVVVLAQPLADEAVEHLRSGVISEMRSTREAAQAESLPSPVSDHYLDLLKRYLQTLTIAASVGAWRTAVYLRGDAQSLPRLSSVWRSTFSGIESIPDAVRTHHSPLVDGWAQRWALPEVPGAPTGNTAIRPFELQSVLTSDRLAAYMHLPEREVPGFSVDAVARFDAVTPTAARKERTIALGRVIDADRVTSERLEISVRSLTRHALVCGVTGSGKSTTIRHLLVELARHDVPFMVLEPAKPEYRSLATLPELAGRLAVYTVGDERFTPLRINPLAPSPGSNVAVHLDMLKSLFSASFGLWPPLPQILERCLHELYLEYGWDLARNSNSRMTATTRWDAAFPTLSDLAVKIEEYIDSLGYVGEVTANMRAALSTRIDGLTVGGKGRMFDARVSTSPEELFERPVVLELDRLGDEEDQAFLIGLLMIRLTEYRRLRGSHDDLQHLLVVEEAHRLLARPQPGAEASPKGKAVEAFANLLAETRTYGQGVLIADQVPVKLAPEVIKNSNLKVTHRLVAEDDRLALASAMVMDERQRRALATLSSGQAAVFAEGHDAPLLLKIDPVFVETRPADSELFANEQREVIEDCRHECQGLPSCSVAAAALTPQLRDAFGRMAQTLLVDTTAASRLWSDVEVLVTAETGRLVGRDDVIDCVIRRAADRWSRARGTQYSWNFETVELVAQALADAVYDARASEGPSPASAERFGQLVRAACEPNRNPFPQCSSICEGACLNRYAVAEQARTDGFERIATHIGATPAEDYDPAAWAWAEGADIAARVTAFPTPELDVDTWWRLQRAAVAAALCAVEQASMTASSAPAAVRHDFIDRVIQLAYSTTSGTVEGETS